MKSMREYYKECWAAEKPKFVRVMKAVPADQSDYRPHPRSTSAGDLMWLLAVELHDACDLIDRGECSYTPQPTPGVAESIAAYEKHAAALESRLAQGSASPSDANACGAPETHASARTSKPAPTREEKPTMAKLLRP